MKSLAFACIGVLNLYFTGVGASVFFREEQEWSGNANDAESFIDASWTSEISIEGKSNIDLYTQVAKYNYNYSVTLEEDFVEGDVAEMWICNEKNGCDLIRWEINGVKRLIYRQNEAINITNTDSSENIAECKQPSTMFEYSQVIDWKADDENQKNCPTADATDRNKDCGSYFDSSKTSINVKALKAGLTFT